MSLMVDSRGLIMVSYPVKYRATMHHNHQIIIIIIIIYHSIFQNISPYAFIPIKSIILPADWLILYNVEKTTSDIINAQLTTLKPFKNSPTYPVGTCITAVTLIWTPVVSQIQKLHCQVTLISLISCLCKHKIIINQKLK